MDQATLNDHVELGWTSDASMKVIHEEAGLSQGHGLRGFGRLAAGGGGGWCGDAPVIHLAARGGSECGAGLGGSIRCGGRRLVARPDFGASSPERCERGRGRGARSSGRRALIGPP